MLFQDLVAALENRDAIHRQVRNTLILHFSTTMSLGYHSLPLKVCTAVETIGEIAAGGGSRGGIGVGRGELDGEEEGRGLLTLLHEARTLLQVFFLLLSRLNARGPFKDNLLLVSETASFF